MKYRYKLIIGMLALFCFLAAAYFLLHVIGDIRQNDHYIDEAEISSDGKSFYLIRKYQPLASNSLPYPPREYVEYFNYPSCNRTGKKIACLDKSNFPDLFIWDTVRNGELYLTLIPDSCPKTQVNSKIMIELQKATKQKEVRDSFLVYYPLNGQPVVKKIPNDKYIRYSENNAANVILFNRKTGFYHYDPKTEKTTFLCKAPDFKKDAERFLDMNPAKASEYLDDILEGSLNITAGNKPSNFILEALFSSPKNSRKIIYFYDSASKSLVDTDKFLPFSEYISPKYTACNDKFIDNCGPNLFDTEKAQTIKLEMNYDAISPDLSYTAAFNFSDNKLWLTNTITGNRRMLYQELRTDCIVERVCWFPAENQLILTIKWTTNSKEFSEILTIDPITGAIKQVAPPCPYYKNMNNKAFSMLYGLSDIAEYYVVLIDGTLKIKSRTLPTQPSPVP
jgi:hypothetical protein